MYRRIYGGFQVQILAKRIHRRTSYYTCRTMVAHRGTHSFTVALPQA